MTAGQASADSSTAAAPAAPAGNGQRRRASPLARRLAREQGLDLAAVSGSGPGGRIVRRDIESALARGGVASAVAAPGPLAVAAAPGVATAAAATVAAPPPRPIAPRSGPEFTDVALSQIRKTIARRLAESIGPVPTFYLTMEADLTRMTEMREAMAALGDGYKVSYNDLVMKVAATALSQHPEVNAHWLGDRIRQFNRVHLGMAVAVEDGLITPVIRDADAKGLRQIAVEARELAQRARARRLAPDEYTGATFSISNLGMFGIDEFTAIINPPEAGIIAVGALGEKPVAVNGAIVARRSLRFTMSCDHRVIDGATGARFLQTFRRMLENPLLMTF